MKLFFLVMAISLSMVNVSFAVSGNSHTEQLGKVSQWKGYGVTVKRDSSGIVTVDGKPAAPDEVTERATTYQQGLFNVIIYKSGKVALMKQGQLVGYLKRDQLRGG
ncbi:hypothetical protein [Pantoea agglomerans]|uniref:hypothetical protein n=1 Tax=Enterobacter agglomerans TaxID=549 RepID=UPI003D18289F